MLPQESGNNQESDPDSANIDLDHPDIDWLALDSNGEQCVSLGLISNHQHRHSLVNSNAYFI